MAILSFTLSEEGVNGLREALTCLSRFCDEVSLDVVDNKFRLSAMNVTKSAYACFSFNTARFFSRYTFTGLNGASKFQCRLYARVLIAIFRGRSTPASEGKDGPAERSTAIDHCTVSIEDGHMVKSRIVVKIVFRNGCTATHSLIFEGASVAHATFNAALAVHRWVMPARSLRQIMEHFGPGVELLDIHSQEDHVNFNFYTEKALNADQVLKKPLQTSITVDLDEFVEVDVEVDAHVVVSVRDFRTIVQHASLVGADLRARYSVPAKPIRFSYEGDAVTCEFLLMTIGERGTPGQNTTKNTETAVPKPRVSQNPQLSMRASNTQPDTHRPTRPTVTRVRDSSDKLPAIPPMGPPAVPSTASKGNSFFDIRPQMSQTVVPRASLAAVEDGLFVADDGWKPVTVDEEEDAYEEEFLGTVGWDTSVREEDRREVRDSVDRERAGGSPTGSEELGGNNVGSNEEYEATQRVEDAAKFGLFYGLN